MTEFLAIKTDKIKEWEKRKLGIIAQTLTPREVDAGKKSSWAHCAEQDEDEVSMERLADPRRATEILQALALFMFGELRSMGEIRRSRITGVSLNRSSLRDEWIEEDSQPHPIPAYCVTHRSLSMGEQRPEVAARDLSEMSEAFHSWSYTRDELALVLKSLLLKDALEPSMKRDAESLLRQWLS